jgi:hypothetical protein
MIVGANGTGKSAFGDTFECLGYRAVNITNATEAFWFRIFGTIEYGQVTIVVEEFDKMDENSQTMSMLKVAYQPNAKVPRMNNDNSKMEFFYPFCFKIMISEKSPNEDKARGVLDRSFKIKSYKGFPEYNIKEIRNPQGNTKRQEQLDAINDLRKLLLAYRVLHMKDPYKEIDIGLDGRDEELCKPLLQLFYTLGASEETRTEIEKTLQYFLDIKNDRKGDSLEGSIYPIVVEAVKLGEDHVSLSDDDIGKRLKSISATELWQQITNALEGDFKRDNNGDIIEPNTFYSADFGRQYRSRVIAIIRDKFGAEKDHRMKGNNLIFDLDRLEEMKKIYKDDGKIKTRPIDESSSESSKNEGENDFDDSLTHSDPDTRRGGASESYEDEVKKDHDSPSTILGIGGLSESVNHLERETNDSPNDSHVVSKSKSLTVLVGKSNPKDKPIPEIRDPVPSEYHAKAPIVWNGVVAQLIKIKGTEIGEQIVYDAYPATGNFTLKNNFITGHLRLRGRVGGQYPHKYLEFINRVFDATTPVRTIEVCSNRILGLNKCGNCFTVDINPEYKPDLVADGQLLTEIKDEYFERWRCDPPYNNKTAKEMYNCELPSLYNLLDAGARVIKPGSLMFLLCSQNVQSGTIGKGNIKRIGFIYISVVPNNETRILNIYVKQDEKELQK